MQTTPQTRGDNSANIGGNGGVFVLDGGSMRHNNLLLPEVEATTTTTTTSKDNKKIQKNIYFRIFPNGDMQSWDTDRKTDLMKMFHGTNNNNNSNRDSNNPITPNTHHDQQNFEKNTTQDHALQGQPQTPTKNAWSRVIICNFENCLQIIPELLEMILLGNNNKQDGLSNIHKTTATATIDRLDLDYLPLSLLDETCRQRLNIVLRQGLASNHVQLKTLYMQHVNFPSSTITALVQGLAINDTLEKLYFTNSKFGHGFVLGNGFRRHFCSYKSNNSSNSNNNKNRIKHLDFFSCALPDREASLIVQSIQYAFPLLEHLDLGGNHCSTTTLEALNDMLETTKTLKTLNLALQYRDNNNHNNLNGGDMEFQLNLCLLRSGLSKNKSLKTLFLRGNPLDDASVRCLVETCIVRGETNINNDKNNDHQSITTTTTTTATATLERLMLTDCGLSFRAYHYILESLGKCNNSHNSSSLTWLWLDGQHSIGLISKKSLLLKTCAKSMETNMSLWKLYLPVLLTGSVQSSTSAAAAAARLSGSNTGGTTDATTTTNTSNIGHPIMNITSNDWQTIRYYLNLNQGGRKHLMMGDWNGCAGNNNNDNESSGFLSPSLWSLVLNRVNHLTFYVNEPKDENQVSEWTRRRRASVIYYLLQQRVLLEM